MRIRRSRFDVGLVQRDRRWQSMQLQTWLRLSDAGHLLEPPYRRANSPERMCPREAVNCPGGLRVVASNPIELAAEIVAAFVSNNPLPKDELPSLVHIVHTAVARLAAGPESAQPQIEEKTPAVPIRKSITPDFLVCLDDGKRFKSLRRHLTGLGLTPDQYREKWKLPFNYPMVAPNYAAQRLRWRNRSGLARSGRKPVSARVPAGRNRTRPNLHHLSFVGNMVPKTRLTPALAISPRVYRGGSSDRGR
jgi:predicted transcriptional regulator